MRTMLYLLAAVCAIFAFALLLYPLVTTLDNLKNGLAAMITLGMVQAIAPIAIALAVIPLCLAVAFDQASRE